MFRRAQSNPPGAHTFPESASGNAGTGTVVVVLVVVITVVDGASVVVVEDTTAPVIGGSGGGGGTCAIAPLADPGRTGVVGSP